jgi:hypothetical protein
MAVVRTIVPFSWPLNFVMSSGVSTTASVASPETLPIVPAVHACG